ncbi:hypothetical protein NDU88_003912 [Pleurodeles waltl]|uniref:Uncharacterized protein n=1 Tax=Pleurodeles waltl TaxID=8319 RepID=A0AAV7TQD8_PLEWA|nr:hypothetical protein NDU88_003912 [Pleurodeles waltl]
MRVRAVYGLRAEALTLVSAPRLSHSLGVGSSDALLCPEAQRSCDPPGGGVRDADDERQMRFTRLATRAWGEVTTGNTMKVPLPALPVAHPS